MFKIIKGDGSSQVVISKAESHLLQLQKVSPHVVIPSPMGKHFQHFPILKEQYRTIPVAGCRPLGRKSTKIKKAAGSKIKTTETQKCILVPCVRNKCLGTQL